MRSENHVLLRLDERVATKLGVPARLTLPWTSSLKELVESAVAEHPTLEQLLGHAAGGQLPPFVRLVVGDRIASLEDELEKADREVRVVTAFSGG